MTTKTRKPRLNSNKNTSEKSTILDKNRKLINQLNMIIHTQTRLVNTNLNLDSFMNMVAEQIQRLTPATGAAIELVEGDYMIYRAASGSISKYIGISFEKENSISGLCVESRQILHCTDSDIDPRVNKNDCDAIEAKSLIVVPLFYDGEVIGVLKIISNMSNAFNQFDLQTLDLMAGLIGSALAHQILYDKAQQLLSEKSEALEELKEAEKKLTHLANHDYLTGLPNRHLFNEQLTMALIKARRNKEIIALMYLDIDNFKDINDTMGHGVGDKLLNVFAQRLKNCLRASDIVARLGGDEFIILIDDIIDKNNIVTIAKKILSAVNELFIFQDKSIHITTSIGISFYSEILQSPDEFIKQADQALYVSKNTGRNTFYIFQNEILYEKNS